MLKIVICAILLCQTLAQRRFQNEEELPEEEYRPLVKPRERGDTFNPATVHYVNIGAKLQGDYKFGYDTGKRGDGQSFREETRLPDGTVEGAYGYVDSEGRQRIVKYTAGKDGYKAHGDVGPEGESPRRAPAAQPMPVQRPAPQRDPQPMYESRPAYVPQQNHHRPEPRPYNPRYSNDDDGSYVRPSQPVQRPMPQPVQVRSQPPRPVHHAPASPPRRSQAPRQSDQFVPSYRMDESVDYNDEENELPVRNVPIDTTLFNYNIGTVQRSRN